MKRFDSVDLPGRGGTRTGLNQHDFIRVHLMKLSSVAYALAALLCPALAVGEVVPLGELDLSRMRQGYGKPMLNQSIRETSLTIAGRKFAHGVGTHATSTLWVEPRGAERFESWVGLDDSANGQGSVVFEIYGDGRRLWRSGVMKPGTPAEKVDMPLSGTHRLLLRVDTTDDGQMFDHADWGEATFTVTGEKPVASGPPPEERVILTPNPGSEPRINSPKNYGCRPGNPFLYRIPATGTRPMKFTAEGLPAVLQIDAESGIISGTAPERGEHIITLSATNGAGTVVKPFHIISGDKIALTPYMGWNHWYAHYMRISDKMVREAADVLLSSGMADVGYDYVCIDDCWARMPKPKASAGVGGPLRDEKGNILPNENFPDMDALTEYIHSKGVKAGIYTSPGELTCAKYAGSWGHEERDAKQFADWGFDLLKHDWCSYGAKAGKRPSLEAMKKPYEMMGHFVRHQQRDIVFNLCQYGMGDVWEWGAEVGGHSWRTAGDLGFELDRFFQVAKQNARYRNWNRPGEWNDPDYLQIGYVGDAHTAGEAKPVDLTPTEQYAYMSLWSLMAAPLVFSGDLARMDEFTLNVLCNPEVIEINQDPLGQCAAVIDQVEGCFLMVKDMEDGSKAIGLCNSGEMEAEMTAEWTVLGLTGKHRVRDVWRHKDMPEAVDRFTAKVPRHGVVLVRIY